MNVSDIINQVRLAIDEESTNTADFYDTRMDNIIRASITHALKWVLMYVDASMLNAFGETDNYIEEYTTPTGTTSEDSVTLTRCMRVVRVKGDTWHKAVLNLTKEDSDEYGLQTDDTAKADVTHPVAVLVEGKNTKVLCFPKDKLTIDYIQTPDWSKIDTSSTSSVYVPSLAQTAFIYYIAYLVMVAYNETTKASNMLATAKMNAGASLNTQQSS